MNIHLAAAQLLEDILKEKKTNVGIDEIHLHSQVIQDHLDDFEAIFKLPDMEWVAFSYQNIKTLEINHRLTIQFMMFAIGRETLLAKQIAG